MYIHDFPRGLIEGSAKSTDSNLTTIYRFFLQA